MGLRSIFDKWRDESHWGKTQTTDSQINSYVGKNSSGGKHCHAYKEYDSGKSGVIHRGECKVCDDVKKKDSKDRK